MVEYIYNGKPITGVYCSDMRDMLLVKKDAFKPCYATTYYYGKALNSCLFLCQWVLLPLLVFLWHVAPLRAFTKGNNFCGFWGVFYYSAITKK